MPEQSGLKNNHLSPVDGCVKGAQENHLTEKIAELAHVGP